MLWGIWVAFAVVVLAIVFSKQLGRFRGDGTDKGGIPGTRPTHESGEYYGRGEAGDGGGGGGD